MSQHSSTRGDELTSSWHTLDSRKDGRLRSKKNHLAPRVSLRLAGARRTLATLRNFVSSKLDRPDLVSRVPPTREVCRTVCPAVSCVSCTVQFVQYFRIPKADRYISPALCGFESKDISRAREFVHLRRRIVACIRQTEALSATRTSEGWPRSIATDTRFMLAFPHPDQAPTTRSRRALQTPPRRVASASEMPMHPSQKCRHGIGASSVCVTPTHHQSPCPASLWTPTHAMPRDGTRRVLSSLLSY